MYPKGRSGDTLFFTIRYRPPRKKRDSTFNAVEERKDQKGPTPLLSNKRKGRLEKKSQIHN